MHNKDRRISNFFLSKMSGDYVMLWYSYFKMITVSLGYSQKADKHIEVLLSVLFGDINVTPSVLAQQLRGQ